MKTVPTSHFPRGEGEKNTTTPFQLAMEHVHNVSSWLGAKKAEVEKVDQFMIQGGCPFKSFHKSHASSDKNLAVAMEEYSLAAIMGQLGSSFSEDEEEDIGQEQEEHSNKRQNQNQAHPTPPEKGDDEIQQSTSSQISTLSQALKSGTAESHTAAENVHFVKNFIKGIIDRELYMELVTGLYHTYLTLEKLLEIHGPKYFPSLHFPKELSRTEALREDMEFWHGMNWESKPECRTPSPAVKDYIDRMEEVGRIDPLLLLSHAYTRYLGDLSGGKVLSRIARRALQLDGYNGLQFYQFESISSYKVFKDTYRSALDTLRLDSSQIGRLVAEANVGKSILLFNGLFEGIDSSHIFSCLLQHLH
jgi:heme oxygenase